VHQKLNEEKMMQKIILSVSAAKDRCKLTCEAPVPGLSDQYTFYTFGDVQDGVKCDGKGPIGVCIEGVCQVEEKKNI